MSATACSSSRVSTVPVRLCGELVLRVTAARSSATSSRKRHTQRDRAADASGHLDHRDIGSWLEHHDLVAGVRVRAGPRRSPRCTRSLTNTCICGPAPGRSGAVGAGRSPGGGRRRRWRTGWHPTRWRRRSGPSRRATISVLAEVDRTGADGHGREDRGRDALEAAGGRRVMRCMPGLRTTRPGAPARAPARARCVRWSPGRDEPRPTPGCLARRRRTDGGSARWPQHATCP